MRVVDRPKRIGLVLRVAIGVWLMAVVIDRPVAAFQGTLRDVDTVGPWHAASAWRERKVDPTAELGSVIAAAQAELAMGNPERALAILSENPVPDSAFGGAPARIFAIALYRQEEFAKSGVLFARAAGYAGGVRRGVLLAQAAEAHQRAGRLLDAQRYYRLASLDLPEIGGWLAIREAEVTRDTAEALATLERAPDYAWRRAAGVRALLLEAAGDTAGAIAMFTAAGDLVKAARFAWESGDAALARELVYAALDDDEQAGAAADLALADPELAPLDVDDHVNLARTLRRSGEAKAAAALLESVVTTVDSSPATWFEYADMLQAAGDRWGALRAFERASESGPRAAEAEYRGARLLISLRQIARGRRALRAFAAKHPEHEHTPTAVFLLGDLDQDAGRRRTADSLFRIVAERWPQVSIASQARLRLASRALLSGDTASALLRFRAEAENGGARANASRYQIARLKLASGDSVGAYAEWSELARKDSVGYYGTMARQAAHLPPPDFAPAPLEVHSPDVRAVFAEMDLLNAIGLDPEIEELIDYVLNDDRWTVEQQLDIAEHLNARGHTIEGIRLGWRLTRELTLNHPRVVRIIFPWPRRAMVEREAEKFGLDPFLVAGLIRQESAFDPHATSRAGAKGLMQLMPSTARSLARRLGIDWDNSLLTVADANLHVGTAHLAALLRQYDGKVIPSLAAYNAGGRPVARWLRYPEAKDPFLFVERIPYRETRGYVRTLLRNRVIYEALYGPSGTRPVLP